MGLRFGFGQRTGIEIYDDRGEIPELRGRRYRFSRKNVGIGQQMQATPLQIARMTAVIANGAISSVRTWIPAATRSARDLGIAPGTIRLMQRGMEAVVDRGTASSAGLGGFRAAGKTGSAEAGKDSVTGSSEDPRLVHRVRTAREPAGRRHRLPGSHRPWWRFRRPGRCRDHGGDARAMIKLPILRPQLAQLRSVLRVADPPARGTGDPVHLRGLEGDHSRVGLAPQRDREAEPLPGHQHRRAAGNPAHRLHVARRYAYVFYILGIIGLLAVQVIGRTTGGGQRWIPLGPSACSLPSS